MEEVEELKSRVCELEEFINKILPIESLDIAQELQLELSLRKIHIQELEGEIGRLHHMIQTLKVS